MLRITLFSISGVLVFLFIFWKKLKEDYVANQIFTTAFYSLIAFGVGVFVSLLFLPIYWFWLSLGFFVSGLVFGSKRYRMRFEEVSESAVAALLPSYFFLFIDRLIVQFSLPLLYMAFSSFSLILLYLIFNANYKKFTWYKSGKIGFSSFATLALCFLIRSLVALRFASMVSFSGNVEVYLSAVVSLLAFIKVIDLARRV